MGAKVIFFLNMFDFLVTVASFILVEWYGG